MPNYSIAGITFEVVPNNLKIPGGFTAFSSSCKDVPDISVHLNSCENIGKPEGELILDQEFKWVRGIDKKCYVYTCSEGTDKIAAILEADSKWSDASITRIKNGSDTDYAFSRQLGQILLQNRILFHQGILIHASAIEHEGRGIMFSAPSGTGKSTQANLWKRYMMAAVLNGDRPAVRTINGEPFVFGTPWSGSSPEFINRSAPLSAVVILEQSPLNVICRLDYRDAISQLMPRCFMPYHDQSLMELAISNLDTIISSVPVYLLRCRPDTEAVEVTYRCIV